MIKYLLPLILLSCTPQAREACYAQADAHATTRVIQECQKSWDACPVRPEILAELATSYRKCP